MATGKFTGKDLHVKIDDSAAAIKDVSNWIYEVSNPLPEVEWADVTAGGGVTGYTHVPGLQKSEFTISGWMDDTTSSLWDTVGDYLTDSSTDDRTFIIFPAGTSSTKPVITGECHIKAVRMDNKVKDPTPVLVDCILQGGITITIATTTTGDY